MSFRSLPSCLHVLEGAPLEPPSHGSLLPTPFLDRITFEGQYLKLDWYQPLNSDEQMVMTLSHFRPGQTPARDLFSSLGGFPGHRGVSWADALPALEVKLDSPLLLDACTATAVGLTLLSQSQHCCHSANTALTIPTLLSQFQHFSRTSLTLLSQFQPELVCCNSFTVDSIYTPHLLVILCIRAFVLPVYLRFRGTFWYSHGCCLFLLRNILHFALISL